MLDNAAFLLIVFPLAGYGIGSIPFGVILARLHGVDLAKVGSGNVGATNVGRSLGRKWGYLCFVLDVAKALVPVLLAGALLRSRPGFPTHVHQVAWLGVGVGVVLGHVFSVFLRFRGGKGVACSLGVVLGIWPYFTWAGLAALGVWVVVTLLSRYVSLGSVVAAVAFVPLVVAFNSRHLGEVTILLPFAGAIVVLILVRHRANIRRLLAGTENRIGAGCKAASPGDSQ